jgi:uncharacterized membrane protein YhiD involved in acid resistance
MKRTTRDNGRGLATLAVASAAVVALDSLLLAETSPAGADAQPPSLGALVAAGAGFLGLVILFIMIVVHKGSRKRKVEEVEAPEPEPEVSEPESPEEAGLDEDESTPH